MFCPNCGANNTTEQNYCRSCGLNLEDTAKSLLLQIPSAESANLLKYERNVERFGNFALGGFGVVLAGGVGFGMWHLVTKFIISGTNIYAAILLCGFVLFALLSLIFVILNESIKEKKAKPKFAESEKELGNRNVTSKLLKDKPFIPVPSVVEDSTELLLAKNKTRKFE